MYVGQKGGIKGKGLKGRSWWSARAMMAWSASGNWYWNNCCISRAVSFVYFGIDIDEHCRYHIEESTIASNRKDLSICLRYGNMFPWQSTNPTISVFPCL